jgi:spore germination protein GerM
MNARLPATAAALAVALLTILASGCGASDGESRAASATDAASTVETTLYFLTADGTAPIGVRRTIPRRSPFALEALRALLAGPTEDEREQGLTTAIPAETKLLSFRVEDHTSAVVRLTGLPTAGASGVDRVRIITQIMRSLVGLSGIERVWLRNDGVPWGLWRMQGGISNRPYDYDAMLGWSHVCAAKPGTEAVPGDCFSALP